MVAMPRIMIARVEVKNSNWVPVRLRSMNQTRSNLATIESRKGGRKTRNPDAADRLIPMRIAIITAKPSMVLRRGGPVLMQTRPNPCLLQRYPVSNYVSAQIDSNISASLSESK